MNQKWTSKEHPIYVYVHHSKTKNWLVRQSKGKYRKKAYRVREKRENRINDQVASLSHSTLNMLNIDENFNPLQKHQR